MGRRKIEIKAIKDDRNRSVTFLKRKGGLFKKAHELSVLCSVDVAVIIFGHNKKLYEFSSGDIDDTIGRYQYYGGAHEHKGPEDFMGKKDMEDDDDDEEHVPTPPQNSHSPPEPAMMPPHLQNQAFQHIRQQPSASPPVQNGMPFHPRHSSPQPLSRPSSRTNIRRTSSNLVPQQQQQQPQPQPHPQQHPHQPVTQPQGPPQNYAYMPNPPYYNHTAPQNMQPKGGPVPPPPPGPQPQYQYAHPGPSHAQVQQVYMQDQRRQSMPPAFPSQEPRPANQAPVTTSPPQPEQNQFQSPPLPQPKPLSQAAKQHHNSIFTPIEDSRSLLAQHWGNSTTNSEATRTEPAVKQEPSNRAQSIDVASMARPQATETPQPQQPQQFPNLSTQPPQRTASANSVPNIPPPSRLNSMQSDAKRPRLKVQIPSEHSDAEGASPSPKDTGTVGQTTARGSTEASHSSGVVLPPPSPSASALLSAGATGPPNPFARPPPPQNNNSYGSRSDMETPISALPSRFVENGLLPSPSSFYPEWGFGRDTSMLPSPLTFQTPVVQNGPSFRDEEDRKRKTSESSEGGAPKRIKS